MAIIREKLLFDAERCMKTLNDVEARDIRLMELAN